MDPHISSLLLVLSMLVDLGADLLKNRWFRKHFGVPEGGIVEKSLVLQAFWCSRRRICWETICFVSIWVFLRVELMENNWFCKHVDVPEG